jgi:hypothetical protein
MHGTTNVNLPLVTISIMATAVCWGVYGPLLQWGHQEMGSGRLRPFICVGVAYLIIAIVGPIVVMSLTGMEMGEGLASGWSWKGVWWSLIAGVAGALGALGMILAFNFGGRPHYVPPLIFGFAPVVNTFFALWVNVPLREQLRESMLRSSFFGAGLIRVAVGAVIVLVSAPKAGPPGKKPPTPAVTSPTEESVEAREKAVSEERQPEPAPEPKAESEDTPKSSNEE